MASCQLKITKRPINDTSDDESDIKRHMDSNLVSIDAPCQPEIRSHNFSWSDIEDAILKAPLILAMNIPEGIVKIMIEDSFIVSQLCKAVPYYLSETNSETLILLETFIGQIFSALKILLILINA